MDRVQVLLEEIRERMTADRPCAPVECLRPIYELEGYLPQLEGEQRFTAAQQIERVREALKNMPAANTEACLVHLMLNELRHYALMVLQVAQLRHREFADLLHSRDTLHFMLGYMGESELDTAAEQTLLGKWDARLRQSYQPRFTVVLQHYQSLMPLDEQRWWWYLDRQAGEAEDDEQTGEEYSAE